MNMSARCNVLGSATHEKSISAYTPSQVLLIDIELRRFAYVAIEHIDNYAISFHSSLFPRSIDRGLLLELTNTLRACEVLQLVAHLAFSSCSTMFTKLSIHEANYKCFHARNILRPLHQCTEDAVSCCMQSKVIIITPRS